MADMGAAVFLELLAREAAAVEFERPLAGGPRARARRPTTSTSWSGPAARAAGPGARWTAAAGGRPSCPRCSRPPATSPRCSDLDAVLQAIVRRARQLLGTDVAYLTLTTTERGDTYMRVTDGSVSARLPAAAAADGRRPRRAGRPDRHARTSTANYPRGRPVPAHRRDRRGGGGGGPGRHPRRAAAAGQPVIGVLFAANRSAAAVRPGGGDAARLAGRARRGRDRQRPAAGRRPAPRWTS